MSFRSRIARKSLLENDWGPAICLALARFSSHTSQTAAMRAPFTASRFFINTCALPPVPMHPMFTASQLAGLLYWVQVRCLIFVARGRDAVGHFAARIRRSGQVGIQLEGGGVETGDRDLAVRERLPAGPGIDDGPVAPVGLAASRFERAEVSAQGRGRGDVRDGLGRILAAPGELESADEKKLVPNDLVAED